MLLKKQCQTFLLCVLLMSGIIFSRESLAGDPVFINVGSIVVNKETTVGQPISDVITTNVVQPFDDFCNEERVQMFLRSGTIYVSGITYHNMRVFTTNVKGIGVVIGGAGTLDNPPGQEDFRFIQYTEASLLETTVDSGCHSIYNQVAVQLIKTGDIENGILTGDIGYIDLTLTGKAGGKSELYLTNGSIITSSCSVTTPNITVPLGQHKKSEFTGVGSATDWQNFSIGLNCDPNAQIHVQINATPVPDAGPGTAVMQLDDPSGSDTAKGVGVELRYQNDKPLILNQSAEYKTTVSGGPETVQLKARYYQTSQDVSAGVANGTATFTLTYK